MEFSEKQKEIIRSMTRKKDDNSWHNYQFHKVNFTFLSNWINFTQS